MTHGRRLWFLLGTGVVLALVQQQLLLRRPPRLLELRTGNASSGPAALDLVFSRPMLRGSLAAASRLQPNLQRQWLGESNPLRLLLSAGQRLQGPLSLWLGGRDLRGQPLTPQRWHWDPRPRVLAVVPRGEGEQLQLLGHDGRWRPLTPVLPKLVNVQPLGDGSGVALVQGAAGDPAPPGVTLWRLPLQQRNLSQQPLQEPQAGALQPLSRGALIFAHLSSNRRGDLLVQASSNGQPQGTTTLHRRDGGLQPLPQQASGPIELLPEGGGLVVPEPEGLSLQAMPGQPPRRQLLPGSRDLSSFCPVSGRALLVRHWPDFRRSLELVEPGQPPRQVWLGDEAVLGSACERGGERVWLLLSRWSGVLETRLLALDRRGRLLRSRSLNGWEVEPGTPMAFDASRRQLLLTMRPPGQPLGSAQPVLIETNTLEPTPLAKPVRLALWLPAG